MLCEALKLKERTCGPQENSFYQSLQKTLLQNDVSNVLKALEIIQDHPYELIHFSKGTKLCV